MLVMLWHGNKIHLFRLSRWRYQIIAGPKVTKTFWNYLWRLEQPACIKTCWWI